MKELKSFVKQLSSVLLLCSVSFESLAQGNASQVASNPKLNSPTDGALIPMLMALVAIIVLIYGLAWLAKRFNFTPNHHQHMKTITSLSLGGRERIVIIEVQGQQYAIGVTPHSVNHLFKLDEPLTQAKLMGQDNKILNKLTEILNNSGQKPFKESDMHKHVDGSGKTKK